MELTSKKIQHNDKFNTSQIPLQLNGTLKNITFKNLNAKEITYLFTQYSTEIVNSISNI